MQINRTNYHIYGQIEVRRNDNWLFNAVPIKFNYQNILQVPSPSSPGQSKRHFNLKIVITSTWSQHVRPHLTHWGRVTHICVVKLTIIGSDNGLSPGRRQAIIWTNAGLLLIRPLGTNFGEFGIGIQTFSFKKMHLKMSSTKWRPSVSASMY